MGRAGGGGGQGNGSATDGTGTDGGGNASNSAGGIGTENTGGGGGAGGSSGGNGGSGVVIIKTPDTVTATFTGATFGNNSPDFDNSLPITSVSGFNIYVVSEATAATVVFN